jgi:uncharacterized membrane protein
MVVVTEGRSFHRGLHPIHAVLLAGTVPLFLGALLSDLAYSSSYEIQWSNFASWLIAGGLVFAGFALLCAVIDLFRFASHRLALGYTLLLAVTWILGFINALIHARDAWAIMPTAIILSVIVTVLALIVTGIGFCGFRQGGVK